MNFLNKLDFLMNRDNLNKMSLSKLSGVPYTTIVDFYKKGYENVKLSTMRKIARYFNVSLDYLIDDSISDVSYGQPSQENQTASPNIVNAVENELIHAYRAAPQQIKDIVDITLAPYKPVQVEDAEIS